MTDVQEKLAKLIAPYFSWDVLNVRGEWINHHVKAQAMEAAAQIIKAYPQVEKGNEHRQ